jgi:hypothetical protein
MRKSGEGKEKFKVNTENSPSSLCQDERRVDPKLVIHTLTQIGSLILFYYWCDKC